MEVGGNSKGEGVSKGKFLKENLNQNWKYQRYFGWGGGGGGYSNQITLSTYVHTLYFNTNYQSSSIELISLRKKKIQKSIKLLKYNN